jgi:hypothetical protein
MHCSVKTSGNQILLSLRDCNNQQEQSEPQKNCGNTTKLVGEKSVFLIMSLRLAACIHQNVKQIQYFTFDRIKEI